MSLMFGYECHDIHSSTNKLKKPPKIKIDTHRVAYTDTDMGIVVLNPIIDRLCFGFFPDAKFMKAHDPAVSVEEYKENEKSFCQWRFLLCHDRPSATLFQSHLTRGAKIGTANFRPSPGRYT